MESSLLEGSQCSCILWVYLTHKFSFQQLVTIHHEYQCGIRKFHPRGKYLVSDQMFICEDESSFSQMDKLISHNFSKNMKSVRKYIHMTLQFFFQSPRTTGECSQNSRATLHPIPTQHELRRGSKTKKWVDLKGSDVYANKCDIIPSYCL